MVTIIDGILATMREIKVLIMREALKKLLVFFGIIPKPVEPPPP